MMLHIKLHRYLILNNSSLTILYHAVYATLGLKHRTIGERFVPHMDYGDAVGQAFVRN